MLDKGNICIFGKSKLLNILHYYSHISGKQPTFQMAYECIIDEISKEYARHIYILDDVKLLDNEKEQFLNIINKKAKDSDYAKALQFLSNCLEKYHENKVIILIDEYDVPLENAFFQGFYDEMIAFIRSLFESALKTNSSLEFSVITGCLRISKESIFTGLNNLEIISILNKSYDEYFGFTQKEVSKMLGDYDLNEKETLVKEWYNGYIFGDAEVYNPWSAVRFVKDLVVDKNTFPSEKNKYDEELRQEGYENIIKYGISFYRKDCIIKLG